MVWGWVRINLACWMLMPLLAVADEPESSPVNPEPRINQPGTSDTTPQDPTIIDPATGKPKTRDPLSDDPGAGAGSTAETPQAPKYAYDITTPEPTPLIDRVHLGVWTAVWRSARRMDGWFGGNDQAHDTVYQQTSGSIAPSVLWDEFDGVSPRLRFQVDVPLPHMNNKLHAFVGRVNRDEYVTERELESGAIARQYGPAEPDETLLGIRYREPRQGGNWSADAGVRIRTPLDPFVKASYRFMTGSSERTLFSFRETVFWQNSENLGFTSRADIERIINSSWLIRWTASGTISQETEGVRGYTALSLMRGFANRRAIAAELFTNGEFDAPVPTENYGLKLAYRRSVARDWLVLETRVSCTFPREEITQNRDASFGVGIGLEMFFGTSEFLARPFTF